LEGLDGKYVDIGFSGATLIVLLALGVCLVVYYFLKRKVPRKTIMALLLLFIVGYGIRLFALLRNPLIYGVDGPWYVTQVKSIIETGVASAVDIEPLVLYFTGGASVFVNDATLGIKITQAFFSALPILTIWLLTFYITKNNLASFVTALLMAFSAMSVGMTDVLRNTGALAFLPLFYLFFFKFVKGEGLKWVIKTPLKIRGKKPTLTFNTDLILSFLIFLVILGCHFLTAGFAVMTVVAYVAFFTGYRRKVPRPELKFVIALGIVVLIGMAASGTTRDKILNTSTTIATSDSVPADIFPFSKAEVPTPPSGEGGGPPKNPFGSFLPFLLLAFPAMWFTLRHNDRRYLLFTATVLLVLLCMQSWIVNYMYAFRFMLMMYIALYVLGGISVWYIRKRYKKIATVVLVAGVGLSFVMIVSIGGVVSGAWITEQTWTELRLIGQRLPENSIITTSEEGLFYWGPLLFDKELGSTFIPGGFSTLGGLADRMRGMRMSGTIVLVVVRNDLVAGENLESLGFEFYNNVQTEHYCVLKLAENSGATQQRSAAPEDGPGELPEYPGATKLPISEESIEENYLGGYFDLSPPEVSAAVYGITASYTEVLNWYKTEMPKLGWTKVYENEDSEANWGTLNFSRGENGAIILVNSSPGGQIITLLDGPAEMLGWSTGPGEGPQGGPFQEPAATNEIRFNHNPLFAFVLLPIEFVQALYGTAVYGVLKLVVAIPLSVGLIGFLFGLGSILRKKFKGWRKIRRRG